MTERYFGFSLRILFRTDYSVLDVRFNDIYSCSTDHLVSMLDDLWFVAWMSVVCREHGSYM
jgi:hypothetical protein